MRTSNTETKCWGILCKLKRYEINENLKVQGVFSLGIELPKPTLRCQMITFAAQRKYQVH